MWQTETIDAAYFAVSALRPGPETPACAVLPVPEVAADAGGLCRARWGGLVRPALLLLNPYTPCTLHLLKAMV